MVLFNQSGHHYMQEDFTEIADPIAELLKGNIETVEYSNGNVIVNAPRGAKVYMAGSFNPLHEGHRGMLAAALKARQNQQGQKVFNFAPCKNRSHQQEKLHLFTCQCSNHSSAG